MTSPTGLSDYLEAARGAETDSIQEHKDLLAFADRLEALYRQIVTGMSHFEHPAAGFLAMQSHANFLAAISTAVRGQCPQTVMILRGCIESAMYAYLISLDKADGDVWLRRKDDPTAAKAKFSANRAIQLLGPRDPHLATLAKDTYEALIEMGGHPNPRSVLAHIIPQPEEAEHYPFTMAYVHDSGSVEVARAICACIENACFALALVTHSSPNHPDSLRVFHDTWANFQSFQRHLLQEGYIDAIPTEEA